jgi:RNA polymerase sigma factor (sigma-70 family)
MSAKPNKQSQSQLFASTQWSLVLAAGHRSSPDSCDALAALCQAYWYPLYAYARRQIGNVHEAQDLTQSFFARLLEKNLVSIADPARGRFRSFLLTSFKNFLVNEWDKGQAKKRGDGVMPLSLDFAGAESRYPIEPSGGDSPERLFERQWVLSLLDHVLDRLRQESALAGKADQFDALKDFISGLPVDGNYAEAAHRLGATENAAKVAAHRLRKRYRELLREEIGRTIVGPEEVDDEIRCLFAMMARK